MDERVDRSDLRVAPDPKVRETPVKSRRRSRYRVLSGLIIVGLAGGGWYLWTHHQTQQPAKSVAAGPSAAGAPQPVGFATVDKGNIRIMLNELGTVTSLDTVTVQTQINGTLQVIGFTEGQVVKKGDFLAQIDPRPYVAALEQAQGTLAKDQGLLAQAQTDLKRYQTLGRQDSIAQQQLDDQKFLVQQYTGQVKTDQGSVDAANVNLAYCHIVSPIDGQIGLRLIDSGNYVQTSSTTGLVVIAQMQPISVVFSVPEDNLPDIIVRVRAGATLSVEAYDRANTRLLATGTLGTLDNQIDTTTGTVKLRAIFTNPDELLYPNQFVNARLLVDTMQDSVRVPVPAVQRGEPGTFVYVIKPDNTVSVRPVKVGPIDGGYQAILSGLNPGERVVTDGTDRLRDGAKVMLPGSADGKAAAEPGSQRAHHHASQAQGGNASAAPDGNASAAPATTTSGSPASTTSGSPAGAAEGSADQAAPQPSNGHASPTP